jgi:sigma-B regulation protein RsbU (phosphoserine phosphatase)
MSCTKKSQPKTTTHKILDSAEEIELPSKIIIYTDGITDAINKNEKMYGEERLLNCLNNNSKKDIINTILNDVTNFVEDNDQFDDMTLLILENNKYS